MYRTCIFCLATLGTNRQIDSLPVGRTIAFDRAQRRLWVVCPSCGRWNLAPIEERGRTLAELDELYDRSSRRVRSDPIGVARLPDGLRLIRIGAASAAEVATWRYGRGLPRRRRPSLVRYLIELLHGSLLAPGVFNRFAVVERVTDPAGALIDVRRCDLDGARFLARPSPDVEARLMRGIEPWLVVTGEDAGNLLDRSLVSVNAQRQSTEALQAATAFLERRGATALLARLGDETMPGADPAPGILRIRYDGEGVWSAEWGDIEGRAFRPVPPYRTIALEMARQTELERLAMQGELRGLRSRWEEAEMLAGIADSL
jgi:hypothetical protein